MKKTLEIEAYQVALIIENRRYHHIRKWLVRMVNDDVLQMLIKDMASIITEEYNTYSSIDSPNKLKGCSQIFMNVITFLHDCHKYGKNISFVRVAKFIINKTDDVRVSIAYHIIPYLIESDSQWNSIKKMIQKKWLSKLSHDDATLLLLEFRSATYLMTGNVSSTLTDMMLTVHDKYYMEQLESGATNMESIVHEEERGYGKGITNILAMLFGHETSKYYTAVIDEGIRQSKEKHPLCKPKYTLGNIWEYCPWYYPENVKDYMVVASYLYVNVNADHPVELSDRLLPILKRIVYEAPIIETDIIPDIVEYLCTLAVRTPDNIRFLAPFRNSRDDVIVGMIDETLKKVISELINPDSNKTLRDFKFLLDNFNSPIILSNDNLQRGFLIHGGKASTLLKSHLGTDISSFIYTSEGLTLAINRSTSTEMDKLIHDTDMVNIMTDEIIGGTYYYNTISFITQAVVNTEDMTQEIEAMVRKINISYPVSADDYDKYRLMITNMRCFDTGITNNDDLLRYVSVEQQSYMKLFSGLSSTSEYIPLWYGLNKCDGINHFVSMDVIRREFKKLNWGYVGDLSVGSLAKALVASYNVQK